MNPFLALFRTLAPRRRRQFVGALLVAMVGAIAELVTIGAAFGFLALILTANPRGLQWSLVSWLDRLGGNPVVVASLALVAAAIVAAAVRLLLNWISQRFVMALGHDIATRIFSRMLRQPFAAYSRRSSSEILSGIEKVQIVVSEILQPAMQGIIAAFIGLVIIILMFAIDPFVAGIAALTIVGTYAAMTFVTRRRLRRNSKIVAETGTARIKIVQEGLGGIRDIILDRSQGLFDEKFRRIDARYRRARAVSDFIASAPRFVVEAAGIAAIALIALAMSLRPAGILAAIPVIGALALGTQRLLPLLQQAYAGWTRTAGSIDALADIVTLLQAPVIADAPPAARGEVPLLQEAVTFQDVTLRHDEGGFLLGEMNLDIPRGARIGICGSTGSGKSTLLDLLMGLLAPDSGVILIDGKPLDADLRASWQAQIAHVPQSIYLADDSIAANIAFGVDEDKVDAARLEAVIAAAQLAPFIAGLEDGIATRVGERGIRLSGGQRQRIGIARALYKGAPVLILDEATSALDDATEAAVMAGIMASGRDVTIVLVAHRQSTLAGCDVLLRVEDGRIVPPARD